MPFTSLFSLTKQTLWHVCSSLCCQYYWHARVGVYNSLRLNLCSAKELILFSLAINWKRSFAILVEFWFCLTVCLSVSWLVEAVVLCDTTKDANDPHPLIFNVFLQSAGHFISLDDNPNLSACLPNRIWPIRRPIAVDIFFLLSSLRSFDLL